MLNEIKIKVLTSGGYILSTVRNSGVEPSNSMQLKSELLVGLTISQPSPLRETVTEQALVDKDMLLGQIAVLLKQAERPVGRMEWEE